MSNNETSLFPGSPILGLSLDMNLTGGQADADSSTIQLSALEVSQHKSALSNANASSGHEQSSRAGAPEENEQSSATEAENDAMDDTEITVPDSNAQGSKTTAVTTANPLSVRPAAPAPSLPTAIRGTPYPPAGYTHEIPWSKVWSTQTLKSKSNQTKMKRFLRFNNLPATQYSTLKGNALVNLVRSRQAMNERALNAAQAATASAAAAPDKDKKRLRSNETEHDNNTSRPTKKTKTTTTTTAPKKARFIPSNLPFIKKGLICVKKLARRDVKRHITAHGYEWDSDSDSSSDTASTSTSSSSSSDLSTTPPPSPFAEITTLFSPTTSKPILSAEAQYRVRHALLMKYGTRALRDRAAHGPRLDAEQRKIARMALRAGRRNYRALVHAVGTSVRGEGDKKGLARELVRWVLGRDVDGGVDEEGGRLEVQVGGEDGDGKSVGVEGSTTDGDGEEVDEDLDESEVDGDFYGEVRDERDEREEDFYHYHSSQSDFYGRVGDEMGEQGADFYEADIYSSEDGEIMI